MSDRCPQCNRPIINKIRDVCLYCQAPLPLELHLSDQEKRIEIARTAETNKDTPVSAAQLIAAGRLVKQGTYDPEASPDEPQLQLQARPLFVAQHNELSVYFISLAFLLVWWKDRELHEAVAENFRLNQWQCTFLLVAGILSFVNVFFKRALTKIEKLLVLTFAVLINTVASFKAGHHLLIAQQFPGLIPKWALSIFPAWNFWYSLLTLGAFREYVCQNRFAELFSDELATVGQFLVGTAFLVLTFFVCYYHMHYDWAMTFCICLSISNLVQFKLLR